jgi:hypothetical protein
MVKVITSSDGHGLADAGEGDDHDPKKGQESEDMMKGLRQKMSKRRFSTY